jgi:hypothetical protein
MLKSKIAAYSNPPAHRVNSQGHRVPASRRHIGIRNRFATSKYLQIGNLGLRLVLNIQENIQESPSYEEMRALSQVLVSA